MRRFDRATGSGAISHTLTPTLGFQLEEIRIHLSDVGTAGDLTVTLDALAGAAYDTILLTQDMSSVKDLAWQPTRPHSFVKGDAIKVAWANGSSRTYGMEIVWSALL